MKEGKTPKELCDFYWDVHKKTYDWFELGLVWSPKRYLEYLLNLPAASTTLGAHRHRNTPSKHLVTSLKVEDY